jgi:DNA-binding response OmpR family regulator
MDARPIICVIDDNEFVRLTICAALNYAGFATVQAAGGDLGLKEIARTGARVAIVDMIMPNKEGLETIADTKRRFPQIRILAVSGGWPSGGPDTLLKLAREFGADDVLAKPFRNADLVEKVTHLAKTSVQVDGPPKTLRVEQPKRSIDAHTMCV